LNAFQAGPMLGAIVLDLDFEQMHDSE